MIVFLSEFDSETIIETQYVSGDIFENTVELMDMSTGDIINGTFNFGETLVFTQKLGGYNTKNFDIRAMIPHECKEYPVKECFT